MSEQDNSRHSNFYLSEPIDEASQNSYVKVNKKYLNGLHQIHQIQQISQYRKQSSEDQQELSVSSCNNEKNYNLQQESQNQRDSQRQQQQLEVQYPNLNSNVRIDKLESDNDKQNTLQYYLLRKSVKTINDQSRSKISVFNQMIQKQRQLLNFKIDTSPNRFHSPQRSIINKQNMLSEFQRTNYRKMLESQIKKNKELQFKIHKLQNQLAEANLQISKHIKKYKRVSKEMIQMDKVKKQQKQKISQLDYKVKTIKSQFNTTYINKNTSLQQTKKQNKKIKDQNQKVQSFINALCESLLIVKGKKIVSNNLQGLWIQLKDIFQKYSEAKKLVKADKSNKSVVYTKNNSESMKFLKTHKKNINHS